LIYFPGVTNTKRASIQDGHTRYHNMVDYLSREDSRDYSCLKPWGIGYINPQGFDFPTLWNITQLIQQYCPTDSRLWLQGNTPATPENAQLTRQACMAFVPGPWTKYQAAAIWVRLTTWKFPLFQLVASSPRPPLGFAVEGFVIAHLLGDPIGTIKDLLSVISSCQQRANFWLCHLGSDERHLTSDQARRAWQAFTIITISYDEWRKGDKAQEFLQNVL
jgi:hypothetical protein